MNNLLAIGVAIGLLLLLMIKQLFAASWGLAKLGLAAAIIGVGTFTIVESIGGSAGNILNSSKTDPWLGIAVLVTFVWVLRLHGLSRANKRDLFGIKLATMTLLNYHQIEMQTQVERNAIAIGFWPAMGRRLGLVALSKILGGYMDDHALTVSAIRDDRPASFLADLEKLAANDRESPISS